MSTRFKESLTYFVMFALWITGIKELYCGPLWYNRSPPLPKPKLCIGVKCKQIQCSMPLAAGATVVRSLGAALQNNPSLWEKCTRLCISTDGDVQHLVWHHKGNYCAAVSPKVRKRNTFQDQALRECQQNWWKNRVNPTATGTRNFESVHHSCSGPNLTSEPGVLSSVVFSNYVKFGPVECWCWHLAATFGREALNQQKSMRPFAKLRGGQQVQSCAFHPSKLPGRAATWCRNGSLSRQIVKHTKTSMAVSCFGVQPNWVLQICLNVLKQP